MEASRDRLACLVEKIYREDKERLNFHNWRHIAFVRKHARNFAVELKANEELVDLAALLHDINYVVNIGSRPEAGSVFRKKLLKEAGYRSAVATEVEDVISSAHTDG